MAKIKTIHLLRWKHYKMKREILLFRYANMPCAALIENGYLVEFDCNVQNNQSMVIYKGVVERYIPQMQAAFVNIGLSKNAFLPLSQTLDKDTKSRLDTGRELVVQIKRYAVGDKGAYLTENISLSGRFVVYMPYGRTKSISSKITNPQRRVELKTLMKPYEGFILRTACENASNADILSEYATLEHMFKEALLHSQNKKAPCVVLAGKGKQQKWFDDYNIDVVLNERAYEGNDSLPVVYRIEKQLERALNRKVWLRNGGYIVIDVCEAMTVIDVNSGKFTGRKNVDMALALNLEACEEIAIQLRLRNIGGIIMIDFIDMTTDDKRTQVKQAFEEYLAYDRHKTTVYDFTYLGLLELSREKEDMPLSLAIKELTCHV